MSFTDLTPEQIVQRMRDPEKLSERLAAIVDATQGMTDVHREAILQLFFMLAENQTALVRIMDKLEL